MRFQPGRKTRTAPATCSVSMYLRRASTSSKDVSFSLICAMERLVSAKYSGPQMVLQFVCGGRTEPVSGRTQRIRHGWDVMAETHVVLNALLVFVLLLAVHGRGGEVGHLDAVLQEILWNDTGSGH